MLVSRSIPPLSSRARAYNIDVVKPVPAHQASAPAPTAPTRRKHRPVHAVRPALVHQENAPAPTAPPKTRPPPTDASAATRPRSLMDHATVIQRASVLLELVDVRSVPTRSRWRLVSNGLVVS